MSRTDNWGHSTWSLEIPPTSGTCFSHGTSETQVIKGSETAGALLPVPPPVPRHTCLLVGAAEQTWMGVGRGLKSAWAEVKLGRGPQLWDLVGTVQTGVCVMNSPVTLSTTYKVFCVFLHNSYHVKVVLHFNKRNCFAFYFFNSQCFLFYGHVHFCREMLKSWVFLFF